jgi:hypothetical protein
MTENDTHEPLRGEQAREEAAAAVVAAVERFHDVLIADVEETKADLWELFDRAEHARVVLEESEARLREIDDEKLPLVEQMNIARLDADSLRESELQGTWARLGEEAGAAGERARAAAAIVHDQEFRAFAERGVEEFDDRVSARAQYLLKDVDALRRRVETAFRQQRRRVADATG